MNRNLTGEVRFDAEGASYTLVLGVAALISLEESLDKDVNEIAHEMQNKPRLGMLRAVFLAGLLKHHRDITEERAGELMEAVGLHKAGVLIGKSLTAVFAGEEATKTAAVPRKAAKKAA
jgi:hypothetical protein